MALAGGIGAEIAVPDGADAQSWLFGEDQARYVIALACSMAGWGVMILMMSSTPLAMQVCNLSFDDTAFVIQWHVVGMYAPSFFTGHLIRRFGLANILLMGAMLQAGAVATNLVGIEVWNFWVANFLQGIGWNFLFVGGSTLLTTTYRTEERARAQGLHSCPQAAFCSYHAIIRDQLGVPDGETVVCGMSIGYLDEDRPENRLRTERATVGEFATFLDD